MTTPCTPCLSAGRRPPRAGGHLAGGAARNRDSGDTEVPAAPVGVARASMRAAAQRPDRTATNPLQSPPTPPPDGNPGFSSAVETPRRRTRANDGPALPESGGLPPPETDPGPRPESAAAQRSKATGTAVPLFTMGETPT